MQGAFANPKLAATAGVFNCLLSKMVKRLSDLSKGIRSFAKNLVFSRSYSLSCRCKVDLLQT
jgi:hypothetical protein